MQQYFLKLLPYLHVDLQQCRLNLHGHYFITWDTKPIWMKSFSQLTHLCWIHLIRWTSFPFIIVRFNFIFRITDTFSSIKTTTLFVSITTCPPLYKIFICRSCKLFRISDRIIFFVNTSLINSTYNYMMICKLECLYKEIMSLIIMRFVNHFLPVFIFKCFGWTCLYKFYYSCHFHYWYKVLSFVYFPSLFGLLYFLFCNWFSVCINLISLTIRGSSFISVSICFKMVKLSSSVFVPHLFLPVSELIFLEILFLASVWIYFIFRLRYWH